MATPAARLTLRQAYRAERAVATPRPPRTPLTIRAAQWAAKHLPRWSTIRTAVLSTAGFGCLTAAAWLLHIVAGLAVLGISFFLLEALSKGERR